MNIINLALIAVMLTQLPKDTKVTDLGDGYSRVETPSYTIEVPKGWKVSEQTPWGQRSVRPSNGKGELDVMTAPPGQQSWDQLYRTSLYFILRDSEGEPTPYRLSKTKEGLETASFELLDDRGYAFNRYVLIRDKENGLLALSVKVPSQEADKEWSRHFKRLVTSARFKG